MKEVTIVYQITDLEEFKKINVLGLEHNGMKSFAAGIGNEFDRSDDLEEQLLLAGITPNNHE